MRCRKEISDALSVRSYPKSRMDLKEESGMLSSMVCRYDHFLTDWYREWAAVLPLAHYGIDPPPIPQRPHRKAWERLGDCSDPAGGRDA